MSSTIVDRYKCPERDGYFLVQLEAEDGLDPEALERMMRTAIEAEKCPVTGAGFRYEDRHDRKILRRAL